MIGNLPEHIQPLPVKSTEHANLRHFYKLFFSPSETSQIYNSSNQMALFRKGTPCDDVHNIPPKPFQSSIVNYLRMVE